MIVWIIRGDNMNPYNPYFNYGYGYGYQNPLQPQMNRLNQMESQYQNYNMPNYMNNMNQNNGNQNIQNMQPMLIPGKSVESIDVVKVTDAPLDGSKIYFPQTDGKAIYTKQLQQDGKSKTSVYILQKEGQNNEIMANNNQIDEIKKEVNVIIEDFKKGINESLESITTKLDDINNKLKCLEQDNTTGKKTYHGK